MLSFLHPSLPRSRVSNGNPMGDYVWDPFTRLIQVPQWSSCFSSWSAYTSSSTLQPYQILSWSSHPLLLIKILQWLPTCPKIVVQLLSSVRLFATPRTAAHQASLFFTIFWSLLKLMSIESVMPSNHLILCCPLLLLPSIFPNFKVFSNELRWPKYWSFSFSISPSNEFSGLISFSIDWLDLFAVQVILKSLI